MKKLIAIALLSMTAGILLNKIRGPRHRTQSPFSRRLASRPVSTKQIDLSIAKEGMRSKNIEGTMLAVPPSSGTSRIHFLHLRAKELRILKPDSSVALLEGISPNDEPGLWINPNGNTSTFQAGVHSNGFPWMILSDSAIRNFGLGRVDGKNASPILVFRDSDIVKMVFGLSMTEAGTPPFLVRYLGDEKKIDVIGRYCDSPTRVCTQ